MSKEEKEKGKPMFFEVPHDIHLGFKLACLMENRSMKRVLLDFMKNMGDVAKVGDVVDTMLKSRAIKKELEEVEEEARQKAGEY